MDLAPLPEGDSSCSMPDLVYGRAIVLCLFHNEGLTQADVGPEVHQVEAQHHWIRFCPAICRAVPMGSAVGLCPGRQAAPACSLLALREIQFLVDL